MAEGWCRHFFAEKYECYSAGTKKHGMNEMAIKVMKDSGIDISKHYSKSISELPKMTFDYVITVCDSAKETCPYFSGGKLLHIGFDDPPSLCKEMGNEVEIMQVYSRVRDEIKNAIKNLPQKLEKIST